MTVTGRACDKKTKLALLLEGERGGGGEAYYNIAQRTRAKPDATVSRWKRRAKWAFRSALERQSKIVEAIGGGEG